MMKYEAVQMNDSDLKAVKPLKAVKSKKLNQKVKNLASSQDASDVEPIRLTSSLDTVKSVTPQSLYDYYYYYYYYDYDYYYSYYYYYDYYSYWYDYDYYYYYDYSYYYYDYYYYWYDWVSLGSAAKSGTKN